VLDELRTRIGSRFSRVEPRRRARGFVLGLLAELPRKNCWTIAGHAGDEVYGGNGPLRTWLETQRIACVLAVACDHRVPAGAGRTIRADHLAVRLPGKACSGIEENFQAGKGLTGLDERDRPPALRPCYPARARHLASDALVTLAAPLPAPRPDLPLPEANIR
jgi:hypothetical protein